MSEEINAFETQDYKGPIRQGEIITNFPLLIPLSEEANEKKIVKFVVVLSQRCDLEYDYIVREKYDFASIEGDVKELPTILFLELEEAKLEKVKIKAEDKMKLWHKIEQNQDIRYQYLSKVDESKDMKREGISELVGDFKRHFSAPTQYIYDLIRQHLLERRCFLISPYAEEVSLRFAFYISRIPTPVPHHKIK